MNTIRLVVFTLALSIVVVAATFSPYRVARASEGETRGSQELILLVFDRPNEGVRIKQKIRKNSGSVELCGDLCDFFSWSNATAATEIWNFIAVFEYYRGVGSQLEGVTEIYKPQAAELVAGLLSNYKHLCPSQSIDNDLASCVLRKLANKNRIRVGFVNYDEGDRCFAWGDVSDPRKVSEYKCVSSSNLK